MSAESPSLLRSGSQRSRRGWWIVLALLAAATLAGLLLDEHLAVTSQAMVYVLAVALASYVLRWVQALACALGAVTLLNYFFIAPKYTLRVEAPENGIALVALGTVALAISHLGTALRREAETARLNEQRALQLQALATELASAREPGEVKQLAEREMGRAFAGPCVVALPSTNGELDVPEGSDADFRNAMRACVRESATLGPGTGRWPGLDAWYIPLKSLGHVVGAACVQNALSSDPHGREHAQAICALAGQALWRLQLAREMHEAETKAQWHRAQNTFLASISHDFRTPLAAIVGAASALRSQGDKLPPEEQRRLLASIENEAGQLAALTENTLQLVRLENLSGLAMDWQSIEELVGSVLARIRQRDGGHRIASKVPSGLPLIKGDPVLLAQLLENLLDNALKYSADAVELEVTQAQQRLEVAIHDRGAGIPADQRSAIFEPYQRNDRSGQRGAGLGLAVSRAIARAHGGELSVQARVGGGSSFVLHLPVELPQPEALAP